MKTKYIFEPLNVIDNPFYFGIGGLGDFLLLMSTFYDKTKNGIIDGPDVIFVCNNIKPIRELSKKFDLINRFWFYPRKSFPINKQMWNEITNHNLCCGTGVTPAKFDYVGEWIKCGTNKNGGVFSYYNVKKFPYFSHPTNPKCPPYIVIQPYGGADDKTKLKEIPTKTLKKIIIENDVTIKIIGSQKDLELTKDKLKNIFTTNIEFVSDIGKAYELIRGCHTFYGADSWGKTVACFAGKKTFVYPNQYTKDRGPMEMFGHPTDPGDYVFLKGWNLDIVQC